MWAAAAAAGTVSYPQPMFANSLTNRENPCFRTFNLRASLSNYPLASRIMVRNLPFTTHEHTLQKEFSAFGEVAEVKLVKDEITKKSKGYAFIQYTSQDDALLALESMDHKNLDGRLIYVDIAKPGKDRFGGYPRTSGPPKQQPLSEQDEVADCWY
ncbi:RRM domain-containing protein [Citrus sinensis]|uniref:organelle RRM domain-containing protein 1, chloroplastic n=1 Tax=Citrus sinensis TaxID=2711 RepID=UPI00218CD08A|nr:organelle RRM domain-containing protein 1, chloroplastic [Citrus sinensis]KAH9747194.1 RRM domain-containing protein [Citrus sinensis]